VARAAAAAVAAAAAIIDVQQELHVLARQLLAGAAVGIQQRAH
jgi:hypothetical protein